MWCFFCAPVLLFGFVFFIFVILSFRFLVALWSPAGKGMTSRASCL